MRIFPYVVLYKLIKVPENCSHLIYLIGPLSIWSFLCWLENEPLNTPSCPHNLLRLL